MAMSNANKPRKCQQKTAITDGKEQSPFLHCAHLILPWLTPSELANTALCCKTLSQISKSITWSRSLDASRSLENIPIPFHNTVDEIPYSYFIYTPSQLIASSASHFLQRQRWGPDQLGPHSVAQSDPGKNSKELAPLVEESAKMSRNGVEAVRLVDHCGESVSGCDCEKCLEVGSDESELFGCPCFSALEEVGMASECGPSCGCGLECENRLTQRGISVRLKILRDVKKGWGLYAYQLIRQGQFICEYAGELLTTKEARRRQQIYDELASRRGICSALLVIREHLPSGKACLRMNIDATRVGNIARFINHSCDGGNLSTILVRSSGALLPRLCFFASKDIKEGEELTFSYGEIRVRSKGLTCFCGSSSCFGILPSEHT